MATVQANNRLQPVAVASWIERSDDAALDAGAGVPPEVAALRARILGVLAGRAAALAFNACGGLCAAIMCKRGRDDRFAFCADHQSRISAEMQAVETEARGTVEHASAIDSCIGALWSAEKVNICADRIACAVLRALETAETDEARERRANWRAFYAGLPTTAAVADPATAHPERPSWWGRDGYKPKRRDGNGDAWETEDARAYVLARVERIRERSAA